MEFETEEKTFEITRFFQRLFYSITVLIFLFISFLGNKESPFKVITWISLITFMSIIFSHIFILSKYTWSLVLLVWLFINVIYFDFIWENIVLYGREGGTHNFFEVGVVLIITFVPNGILSACFFYFKPKCKRYNKRLNPPAPPEADRLF